jgi:DNA-binding NtrC family response regulator
MPGLSGLELLGHIGQRFANIPVIIISGIGDQEHAQGLINLGAFDFLFKPFTLEVVEKSVKRAVGVSQAFAGRVGWATNFRQGKQSG